MFLYFPDISKKYYVQEKKNLDNWQAFKIALKQLNQSVEAKADRTDEYGTFYNVSRELEGVNGINLSVVTITL